MDTDRPWQVAQPCLSALVHLCSSVFIRGSFLPAEIFRVLYRAGVSLMPIVLASPLPSGTHPPMNDAASPSADLPAPDAVAPPAGPIRATISGGYRVRLLILALGLLAFAGWSLYDGIYAWPKKQAMYEDLQVFMEQHDDWQTRWSDHARAQGYPESVVKNPTKLKPLDKYDIATQYGMAAVCGPIGLWFAYCWFAAGRRYVEADERGVRTHANVDLTWTQIEKIEDDRWKSKGIAYLKYAGDQRILLDDWKFDRDATTAIYKLAESKMAGNQENREKPENQENPDKLP